MSNEAKCNCQHCNGHIAFPPEMAGQSIACPHCQLETPLFMPPAPVPPKQPKPRGARLNAAKLAMVLLPVSCLVGVVLFGFPGVNSRHHMLKGVSPSERHYLDWRDQARGKMLAECTNAVTGCNRIIDADVWDIGDDPNKWTGEATVEFMNRIGGTERTNVPFRFLLVSGDTIACLVDSAKVRALRQDRDDWEKHLSKIHADSESRQRDILETAEHSMEKVEHSRKLLDFARQEALSRTDAGTVAGPRVWSLQAGGKVEGTFVRFQGTNAIVITRTSDAREYILPLAQLSEFDNDYLELTLKP